ncbi:MAG TPA: hypothetical protein V6D02_05035 [Candidatus Obscuribacterales bacterium]
MDRLRAAGDRRSVIVQLIPKDIGGDASLVRQGTRTAREWVIPDGLGVLVPFVRQLLLSLKDTLSGP